MIYIPSYFVALWSKSDLCDQPVMIGWKFLTFSFIYFLWLWSLVLFFNWGDEEREEWICLGVTLYENSVMLSLSIFRVLWLQCELGVMEEERHQLLPPQVFLSTTIFSQNPTKISHRYFINIANLRILFHKLAFWLFRCFFFLLAPLAVLLE